MEPEELFSSDGSLGKTISAKWAAPTSGLHLSAHPFLTQLHLPIRPSRFLCFGKPELELNCKHPSLRAPNLNHSPLYPFISNPLAICKHAQEVSPLLLFSLLSLLKLLASWLTIFCSGIARSLGRSAFARPSFTRRAFEPLRKQAGPALAQRWASTDSAKDGKIHQVIGAVVDGKKILLSCALELPQSSATYNPSLLPFHTDTDAIHLVKFDSDQLPPILNALETDNNGQKLVLEVAVRISNRERSLCQD